MKARIKKTSEIVDIIAYNHFSTIRSSRDYVSYIDSKGVEHDRESLNYYWDFESIEADTINNEYWQNVRERAAIAAMQGILCAPIVEGVDPNPSQKHVAELAVMMADELIDELKNKKDEDKNSK